MTYINVNGDVLAQRLTDPGDVVFELSFSNVPFDNIRRVIPNAPFIEEPSLGITYNLYKIDGGFYFAKVYSVVDDDGNEYMSGNIPINITYQQLHQYIFDVLSHLGDEDELAISYLNPIYGLTNIADAIISTTKETRPFVSYIIDLLTNGYQELDEPIIYGLLD